MTDHPTLPPPAPSSLVPRGVSIYARRIASPAAGIALARRCADHGLTALALEIVWQDERGTLDLVKRGAELACAEECHRLGVQPWGWGYPDAGHEDEYCATMREHATALGLAGLLPDVEKPYRNNLKAARALVGKVIDSLDEGLGLGVTMFGNPDLFTDDIAGLLASVGFASPQVYTVEPWRARKFLEAWARLSLHAGTRSVLIPSVPTYGPNSEGSLGAYLGALEDLVDGFIAWSEPSTSELEWKTLERWGERFRSRPASSRAA